MRSFTRLWAAASVILLLKVLVSFWSLDSEQKIERVSVGTDYVNGLLRWATGNDGGVQLVVFGDSWVDNAELDGEDGRGQSWVEYWCEMMDCSSTLNFATTHHANFNVASPPTGALVSNEIYLSNSSEHTNPAPAPQAADLLPDLAAQIQQYINLPRPDSFPKKTYYLVSFGLWDVFHATGLNFEVGSNLTALAVSNIFRQLDILQDHVVRNLTSHAARMTGLEKRKESLEEAQSDIVSGGPGETFEIIIPKLFDPSLLPGWMTQRPRPLSPSSISDQQRKAIKLTAKWNDRLEASVQEWLFPFEQADDQAGEFVPMTQPIRHTRREIYLPDIPTYLVSMIAEGQVQSIGITDASGVGTREGLFEYVRTSCVVDSQEDGESTWSFGGRPERKSERREKDGKLVCKNPEKFLFWDAWTLGRKAKEHLAELVNTLVVEGQGMRGILEEGIRREMKIS